MGVSNFLIKQVVTNNYSLYSFPTYIIGVFIKLFICFNCIQLYDYCEPYSSYLLSLGIIVNFIFSPTISIRKIRIENGNSS